MIELKTTNERMRTSNHFRDEMKIPSCAAA
jgi:hypothetical protein